MNRWATVAVFYPADVGLSKSYSLRQLSLREILLAPSVNESFHNGEISA